MSPTVLLDWQQWFTRFWEVTEQKTAKGGWPAEPLRRVQHNWERWCQLCLSAAERRQVEDLAEATRAEAAAQQSFAHWLEEWIDRRFRGDGTGRLVLTQLAQIPLFRAWSEWAPYRRGANAFVVLESIDGRPDKADIMPLIVVSAIDVQKNSADPRYTLINLKILEGTALREVRKASLNAFRGMVFWIFLLSWALCGRKYRRPWLRNLIGISWVITAVGWALVAGLVNFLPTTDLFTYFQDDGLFVPPLLALVIIPTLSLLYVLTENWREGRRARRQGREWAEFLERSQLYLLVDNQEPGSELEVSGPSFGPMLALRSLLSIYETRLSDSQPSWLWLQFFKELAERLPHLGGTGEVTSFGRIKRITLFDLKWTLALAHPEITEVFAPFQRDALRRHGLYRPTVSSSDIAGQASEGNPSRPLKRLWFQRGERNDGTKLLRCCFHLAQMMLTVGNLASPRSVASFLLMLLISLFIVWGALPGVTSIVSDVTPTERNYFVYFPDAQNRPQDRRLLISFRTDIPDEFEVYDSSQHQTAKVTALPKKPGYAVTSINLNGRNLSSSSQVIVELRHHRRLLGVSLPDETVLTWAIP